MTFFSDNKYVSCVIWMHIRSLRLRDVFLKYVIYCCRAIFICRGTISQSRRAVLASFPRHIKFYSGVYTKEEKTHRVRAFYVTRQIIYLNVSNSRRAKLCYAILLQHICKLLLLLQRVWYL